MKHGRIFLALLLVAALLLPVMGMADVIWEPDDDFFFQHRDACEYVERQYSVSAATEACKSPEDSKVVLTLQPDTAYYVNYLYTDGKGVCWVLIDDNASNTTAWVEESKLHRELDCGLFLSIFEGVITDYDGRFDEWDATKAYFWSYPGAAQPYLMDIDAEYRVSFTKLYTDAEGKVWAYTPYYMGMEAWICPAEPLSESLSGLPTAEQVPAAYQSYFPTLFPDATASPTASNVPAQGDTPVTPAAKSSVPWVIIAVVAAVVLVTVVLLVVLFGKKKKQD